MDEVKNEGRWFEKSSLLTLQEYNTLCYGNKLKKKKEGSEGAGKEEFEDQKREEWTVTRHYFLDRQSALCGLGKDSYLRLSTTTKPNVHKHKLELKIPSINGAPLRQTISEQEAGDLFELEVHELPLGKIVDALSKQGIENSVTFMGLIYFSHTQIGKNNPWEIPQIVMEKILYEDGHREYRIKVVAIDVDTSSKDLKNILSSLGIKFRPVPPEWDAFYSKKSVPTGSVSV